LRKRTERNVAILKAKNQNKIIPTCSGAVGGRRLLTLVEGGGGISHRISTAILRH